MTDDDESLEWSFGWERERALRFEDLFLRESLSRSKSRGEKQKRASSCLCFRTLHYGALCFGKSCHYLFAKKAETLTCIDLRSQKKTALTRVSLTDVTASKGATHTSAQSLLPVGPTQKTATLFLFVFILFRRRSVRLVCLCSVCSSKKSADRARQLGVHHPIFSPITLPNTCKTIPLRSASLFTVPSYLVAIFVFFTEHYFSFYTRKYFLFENNFPKYFLIVRSFIRVGWCRQSSAEIDSWCGGTFSSARECFWRRNYVLEFDNFIWIIFQLWSEDFLRIFAGQKNPLRACNVPICSGSKSQRPRSAFIPIFNPAVIGISALWIDQSALRSGRRKRDEFRCISA